MSLETTTTVPSDLLNNCKIINIPAYDNNYSYTYNSFFKKCFYPNKFEDVIEYVPNKVYKFIFNDGTNIKTVCDDSDTFNLEYAFYLALAKKIYSDKYTFEGILKKVEDMKYEKDYIKTVKEGIKLFKDKKKKEAEERKKEMIKKHQKERYINKKIRRDKRRREQEQDTIYKAVLDAIADSKQI